MVVRGWLIIGHPEVAPTLPVGACMGWYDKMPSPAHFMPGQWVVWQTDTHKPDGALALVCVDLPVGELVR